MHDPELTGSTGVGAFYAGWSRFAHFPGDADCSPLRERFIVTGLVVMVHAALFSWYWMQPETPAVKVNDMSVSFATLETQQAEAVPQARPRPREAKPEPVEEPKPAEEPVARETVQNAAPQVASPPAPEAQDAEPDYKADYLNNPRPAYPMVARRMGYQGTVVLDVEVLANGRAGDVKLHQSSGYDILDNAAIQTVKSWRFTPARRMGQPVTKRFLAPIKFSLEDSKA